MARYRHYRNTGDPHDTCFITSTCLDFARAFERPEIKNALVRRIAYNHLYYRAPLHGFVVMANHIHLVSTMPSDKNVSSFMRHLKSNTAREVIPLLAPSELKLLGLQSGLDRRQLWQRSFRSLPIDRETTLQQKLEYVHENPVRAGLAASSASYLWSSARIYEQHPTDDEAGIAELVFSLF